MANKKNDDTLTLVSQERALAFCAMLNDNGRRVLATCIDGEIAALGYQGGVRAGNPTWNQARRKAVTELVRREIDLAELGASVLPALEENLHSPDEATRDAARAGKKRVERYAEHLAEEAHERLTVNTAQEWDEAA